MVGKRIQYFDFADKHLNLPAMKGKKMKNITCACILLTSLLVTPSWAVTYFSEDFESIPASQLPWSSTLTGGGHSIGVSNAHFDQYTCSDVGCVQLIAGAGRNGGNAVKFTWTPGTVSKDSGLDELATTSGYEELFVRSYIKLSTGYPWGGGSDLKLFRWYGVNSIIPAFSTNAAPWDGKHRFRVDGNPVYPSSTWVAEDHINEWHCFEIRTKMNTPGTSDGIIQAWIDDVLVINTATGLGGVTGWSPRGTGVTTRLWGTGTKFSIGGNIPGAANTITGSDWYDDIVVSDTRIGCGASTAPLKESSPPKVPFRIQ